MERVNVEIGFNNSVFDSIFVVKFSSCNFLFFFFFFVVLFFSSRLIVIEEKIFANTEVLLWMAVTGAVSPAVRAQQYACDLFENNKR